MYTCTGLTDRKGGRRADSSARPGQIRLSCGLQIFTPDRSGAKCPCFPVYALISRRTLIFRLQTLSHERRRESVCFCSTRKRTNRNRNFGYSLDPNPNDTRKQLYEHYAKDAQFVSSDVVFCSHPISNCEIYLPFDKSILLCTAQRLEFGETTNTCGGADR